MTRRSQKSAISPCSHSTIPISLRYHWIPKQGVRSWTAADAAAVQADDLGAHTEDLRAAIERGDYPEWELRVQIMPDGENHELDFDPLDDTKVWPEAEARGAHGARPQREQRLRRERADRLRDGRAR